eukprot:jgi/Tetstr1/446044/TSEL_033646.t1
MPVRTRGRGAASPAWKLLKLALIGWFLTAEVGCCDLDRATLLQYQHAGTLAWDTAGSTAAWEDAGPATRSGAQSCALSALEELHLEGNTLTGPLPLGWSGLERLEELSLGGNALRGPLPAAWSELRELEELKLAGNGLSGTLPAQWSAMRLLESLDLAATTSRAASPRNGASP